VRDAAGRTLHYEWSLADITERRQLESQLRQAQKMEAVGQLAGGVAHDFNNLLTVIGGRCYLMLAQLAPDDTLRHEVELVRSAAERAGRLIHQLLAFSRKQVLEPRVLDLNETVTGIEPLLRRLIGEDIEIRVTHGSDLGRVKADAGQIEQVILNLAVNARDAMPQGGQLVLETADAVVDERAARRAHDLAPGRYVVLSVTDSGHGMDAATRAQIFEPFFTTKGNRGTGLGLSSVYGIVKQSGGYIWCDSTPGQGTTFTIYLKPAAGVADDESQLAPTQERAAGGDERVLVVDDEPAVRRLLARILRSRGYDVFETEDAPSALAFMSTANRPMDLVVTDIVMPSMSGVRLAEQIKAQWPSVKILFVSGFPADEAIPASELASVPLLGKPFTPDEIETKVRELLDKRA
jgi:two-component system cell cycle sensor histidine kinase/response regulator CckA